MTNLMELVKIIDLYEKRVDDKRRKKLSTFSIVGSIPPNIPRLSDLVYQYKNDKNFDWRSTYVACVPANMVYSSPLYNRPYEIDLNRCERYVQDEGAFSYVLAGTGSGYVRPDGTKRNPQNTEHKFRSAYRSKENWAVKLFNYLQPFSIGIAGTLENANFILNSHSYLSTALNLTEEGIVTRYLKTFTQNNCEKELLGNAIVAGCLFLQGFSEYISKIDKDNNIDSFDLMMKFYFTEYGSLMSMVDPDARDLTQTDLVKGNSLYKGNEPAVARFVFCYNDFIRVKRYKISGRQKTAIPFEGSEDKGWNTFISNAHPLMKPALGQLATTKFF